MTDYSGGDWIAIILVLVIGVAIGWWLYRAIRRKSIDTLVDESDVVPDPQPVPQRDATIADMDAHPAVDANDVPVAPAPSAPPTTEAERPLVTAATGEPDNLQQIKGIGPKLATLLTNLGITRFDQIATWTDEDVARIDPQLQNFQGRIRRDNWIDQARYLVRGDIPGFEGKYGKL